MANAVVPARPGSTFSGGDDQCDVSNPTVVLTGEFVRVAPKLCLWADGLISRTRRQALLFWCTPVVCNGDVTLLCACFLSVTAMGRLVAALSALPAVSAPPARWPCVRPAVSPLRTRPW